MSLKSLDSSSSNDEGSRANCNNKDVSGVEKRSTSTLDEMSTSAASLNHVKNVTTKYLNIKKADNSAKIENDVSQKAKTSNKVLNGRTFRDVIVNAKERLIFSKTSTYNKSFWNFFPCLSFCLVEAFWFILAIIGFDIK